MRYFKNITTSYPAITILEMVIAMAIMAIVFATTFPLFRQIQSNWDSKSAAAESLQNGRVLIDHISRNLAKAVQITAVSNFTETNGYMEFKDNNDITYRYEISEDHLVRFGPVGNLSDLAGPVSQLQFTCYSLGDLDTPTADAASIRLVKVETIVTSSLASSRDKTFTTSAYIQCNAVKPAVTMETPYRFNNWQGRFPTLCNINNSAYLCAYTGPNNDGWAVVLTVNNANWNISSQTALEFDTSEGYTPALVQIDQNHYLCAYTGSGNDGWAVVLTVNPSNWTITKQTPFEFDGSNCLTPFLAKIDQNHYLCVYSGPGSDGWAVVLTVNPSNWTITRQTPFEFDGSDGTTPFLAKIDQNHYLCVYSGPGSDGWATVLTVNLGSWQISKQSPFEFDGSYAYTPELIQVDQNHYLCAYTGHGNNGWAAVLAVNTNNWNITKQTGFEFDTSEGRNPKLSKIDNNNYLCAYNKISSTGYSVVLTVDAGTWAIGKGTDVFSYTNWSDQQALSKIDETHFLCAYEGQSRNGWAVVLGVDMRILP